jgi:hypothetical protein
MECHCDRQLALGLRTFSTECEAKIQNAMAMMPIGIEVTVEGLTPNL